MATSGFRRWLEKPCKKQSTTKVSNNYIIIFFMVSDHVANAKE